MNYLEKFDDGPGGWMRVVDNVQPVAALPVRDGAIWSIGPWWVDYNHAPPGAGYLQLLMCLPTKGPFGEHYREVAGTNHFVEAKHSLNFTNARFGVRIKGELEPAGASACLLVQGSVDGLISGWVLTGQPIRIEPGYTDQVLDLVPDDKQWRCLGARFDRRDMYGVIPLETVLANVNVNIFLVMFPVTPRLMGPHTGDLHILRAGKDYPIWPSSIAQGYVAVDTIGIEFA